MKSIASSSQNTSRNTNRSRGIPQRESNPKLDRLRQLTAELEENLALCAHPNQAEKKSSALEGYGLQPVRKLFKGSAASAAEGHIPSPIPSFSAARKALDHHATDPQPTVEAVHRTRTGTRRIEAILQSIRNPIPPRATDAIARWEKLLRKIRRAAAPVRDIDVHRHLLQPMLKSESTEPPIAAAVQHLDAWLQRARRKHARPLVKGAAKWAARLEPNLNAVTQCLQTRAACKTNAAITALHAFAQLSIRMHHLNAGNLHDFRKGAKKARYMAETGGSDEYSEAIGKALKKLQDEIGDWHDWLVLAEEAHRALGDHGTEVIARIEEQRDQHYKSALKTAERMRGRLMGEWATSTGSDRPRKNPGSRRVRDSART